MSDDVVRERREIPLKIGESTIQFLLSPESDDFVEAFRDFSPVDKWILVADADPAIERRVGEVEAHLATMAPVELLSVTEPARRKDIALLHSICSEAIRLGATRRTCVVGVGGGTICNIAGLAAATLYRGVRLVQVPTTLLAATDAVVSLKQAVNVGRVKNGFGTFYAPKMVWANPEVICELPVHLISEGFAELVKNALAISPEQISSLQTIFSRRHSLSIDDATTLVDLALHAKSLVIRDDPRESGRGLVLEYGHTMAHALETLSAGWMSHGAAVGLGLRVAARVSHELGFLGDNDLIAHDELVCLAGLPDSVRVASPRRLDVTELDSVLRLDNKRGFLSVKESEVAMVLLEGRGRVAGNPQLPLMRVDIDLVVTAASRSIL